MTTIDPASNSETSLQVAIGPSYKVFGDDESVYQCRAVFCPEPDGSYSVHATRLPGTVSQGETLDEAIENITDAFRESVGWYLEQGDGIPWSEIEIDRPEGSVERWILVHV